MAKESVIQFYGTAWCPSSRRAKKLLSDKKIEFEWINIDKDVEAREFGIMATDDNRSVPTIVFPDGEILVEPTSKELEDKISQ